MSSWGLGWKRASDTFHLLLSFGADVDTLDDASPRSSRSSSSSSSSATSAAAFSPPSTVSPPSSAVVMSPAGGNAEASLGFRIDLEWSGGDDEEQTALKVQSRVMVAMPSPEDVVEVELRERGGSGIRGSVGGRNANIGNLGDRGSQVGGGSGIKGSVGGRNVNIGNVGDQVESKVGVGVGLNERGGSVIRGSVGGRNVIIGNVGDQVESRGIDVVGVGLKERGGSLEGQSANIGNVGDELKERGGSGISGSIEGISDDFDNVGGGREGMGGAEEVELKERGEIVNSGSIDGGSEDVENVGGVDGNNGSVVEEGRERMGNVEVELKDRGGSGIKGSVEGGREDVGNVGEVDGNNGIVEESMADVEVEMRVVKRKDPLRGVVLWKEGTSGQQIDGMGVLLKLMRSSYCNEGSAATAVGGGAVGGLEGAAKGFAEHWQSVTVVSLCGLGLAVLPVEITRLPLLEKLYLDGNRLTTLPPELGELKNLKALTVDYNMLVSVPVELRQCVELVELSLEHNKLVRPLLDFRAMSELRVLRLFGNPLEFLPDILPLQNLRHLSLANVRIVADDNLRSLNVQIELENTSYFVASRHKLSAFFSLIFRFSSCHHPLLASALGTIMQDEGNRAVVGKDENAVRQLISMISSDNQHVVEQACSALSSLASDMSVAVQFIKSDIVQPIERVLKSTGSDELISVLHVVVTLAFTSDVVAQKILTKDILKSLKLLCAHKNPEVQRLALFAVGNLAFCIENRRILLASESLRELLLRHTMAREMRVSKAAARALAILGENEILRRAIRGRQVPKQGIRILAMDGGGMKGLATVKILKEIEKGTGKQIHELFDIICGTSTGGMLAVALGIKLMSLEKCEEIYKELGKVVFSEQVPKDNEAATWKEKLDQLYKSSSQSFRVVVHGSKHSADQFERLLQELCADDDGDLLIESAVKVVPKVFVVSTLVNVVPAQPYIFRNYQYPPGTPESSSVPENSVTGVVGTATTGNQAGYKRTASMGSCKDQVWKAIRASSAAPYYLDDFSDGVRRWQDGAIVANNPTIFAIREAQLLWPDANIDCLVSIGCGSTPTKVRKGGWRYLDTGQVLIESACSVDRVEEALGTLLPMLPNVHYYRFNPVDERCDMELDETDPAIWLKLEAATTDYIQNSSIVFKDLCGRLLENPYNEKFSDNGKSQQFKQGKSIKSDDTFPSLGWRRCVLLIEASNSPDSGRVFHHTRSLETFCSQTGIRLSLMNGLSGTFKPASGLMSRSPMFTGSFPSSPTLFSPDMGPLKHGKLDSVPPLNLDGFQSTKTSGSPPDSPMHYRQASLHVQSMHEKLQKTPQIGVIHLALQNDLNGSILSWQNDVFVVAEPGELAESFLQTVKYNLLSLMRGRRRKYASVVTTISTVADLVSRRPYFHLGGVVHRYIGRQTQVMEDDREISAYMFRRTVPNLHLTPEDVRWMIGAWRDRIIVFTGLYGPTQSMIKAFLDSGAKAVICPSDEPEETQLTGFHGSGEFNVVENGKFEIGEEDGEDDDVDPGASSASDWEDSEPEKSGDKSASFCDDDEEELSQFICEFYDSLFQGGSRVDTALQQALSLHRTMRYSCHLPTIL